MVTPQPTVRSIRSLLVCDFSRNDLDVFVPRGYATLFVMTFYVFVPCYYATLAGMKFDVAGIISR